MGKWPDWTQDEYDRRLKLPDRPHTAELVDLDKYMVLAEGEAISVRDPRAPGRTEILERLDPDILYWHASYGNVRAIAEIKHRVLEGKIK